MESEEIKLERLELTPTMLEKNTINASSNFRKKLKLNEILDYDDLNKGDKKSFPCDIKIGNTEHNSSINFYKPKSKKEFRFSISNIRQYFKSGGVPIILFFSNNKFKIEIEDLNPLVENKFLENLLALQQDGEESISSPKSWTKEPLLYVKTETDSIIESAISNISNEGEKKGIWLFLVGAPGNGKSALTGRIALKLHNSGHKFFKYENNWMGADKVSYDFGEAGEELPYKIEVFDKKSNYSICSFVQDASVVTKKWSKVVPASDMIKTLKECYNSGKSLVVCANRGVLEEVVRKLQNDEDEVSIKIRGIVKKVISSDIEKDLPIESKSGKKVNKAIIVKSRTLENKSLFDQNNYFEQLILKAIDDANWSICNECHSKDLCPFKQNQSALQKKKNRTNLIKILEQYELYSGQSIVFREAVAIISFLLAGSADDYHKNSGSACQWVHQKTTSKDYFNLLTRRIYLSIYNANNPYLIDYKNLKKFLSHYGHFLGEAVSHNVGVGRFFDGDGVSDEIHPRNNITVKLKDYDLGISTSLKLILSNFGENSWISSLEIACLDILKDVETKLGSNDFTQTNFRIYKRLHMNLISTIVYYNKASTKYSEEFNSLIELNSENTSDEKREQIRVSIQKSLSTLLSLDRIKLNSNITVRNLKNDPQVYSYTQFPTTLNVNCMGVYLDYSDKIKDEKELANDLDKLIFIDGKTFANLKFKEANFLSEYTFPTKLLTHIEQSQVKIARESKYNVKPVEFYVKSPINQEIFFHRKNKVILFE